MIKTYLFIIGTILVLFLIVIGIILANSFTVNGI
jgi:hypothetical protein